MIRKKIAIVYDWLDKWGGVERILLTLHEMYPNADFFTSYYNPEKAGWAKDIKIKTAFIQKMPKFIKQNRILSLMFYPYAFESFDFSEYDLVISVTSSFAKAVISKPNIRHICYLLTPARFLWLYPELYFKNKIVSSLISPVFDKLKKWDYTAAQRPDKIISISQTVADRCLKYYKRESEVVYPPFDIDYWNKIKNNVILGSEATPESSLDSGRALPTWSGSLARMTKEKRKYFLVVSRLEPYKKVELVVQSFNQLYNGTLVIVGEGTQTDQLKNIAKKNIVFMSNITDQELGYLYSNAEALIMPQEEDFGYVSLEAQFFGCPVIAFGKGGATETVAENKTGIFFKQQTVESLKSALDKYNMVKYRLKQSAQKFGSTNIKRFNKNKFISGFEALLNQKSKIKIQNDNAKCKIF